jgi:hypothetical protein
MRLREFAPHVECIIAAGPLNNRAHTYSCGGAIMITEIEAISKEPQGKRR